MNTLIFHFLPQIYLPLKWGLWVSINNFSFPYPTDATIPNLIKIGLVVLEKVVNAKCTTSDNRHKPNKQQVT